MSYSERAYFDGDHCQHVADRDEARRLKRINRQVELAHRDEIRPVCVPYGRGN